MHARRVVPALDVAEDTVLGLGPGGKVLPMRLFDFQRMPETLHWRIVETVAGAAHRLPHRLLNQPDAHLLTGVLAAAIRVEDQPRRGFPGRVSHSQRVQHQLTPHMPSNGPADNFAGKQIEHRAHVQPAFARPKIGDVRQPDLVGGFVPKQAGNSRGRQTQRIRYR